MKIAKVNFGYGTYTFLKGQQVPKEVFEKYPHLVEDGESVVENKKDEFIHEGTALISTEKKKRK